MSTAQVTEAELSHDRANWLRVAKERDEIKAERDQLRADRTYNHECINRLAVATGTLGENSEKVVDVVLSTIDQLRAEVEHYKFLHQCESDSSVAAFARARRAEAEVERLHLETARIGKNGAEEYIRAERAEVECLEQARLLGMSASREASLLGKISQLERQLAATRAPT